MTKGEILRTYRHMSAEDQQIFNRWLKTNAVIGSIVSAALVAMALSGPDMPGPGPRQAVAQNAEASEISAAAAQREQSGTVSPHELTIRLAPDQIPVIQVDEPY